MRCTKQAHARVPKTFHDISQVSQFIIYQDRKYRQDLSPIEMFVDTPPMKALRLHYFPHHGFISRLFHA